MTAPMHGPEQRAGSAMIRAAIKSLAVIPAIVAAYLIASTGVAHAQSADPCGPMLSPKTLRGVGLVTGKRVQDALGEIYRKDPKFPGADDSSRASLSDGRIGPVTLRWLRQFCADLSLAALSPELGNALDALLSFSFIISKHPEWKTPLLSESLSRWIEAQPGAQKTRYLKIRVFGPDKEIEGLLRAYEEATAPPRETVSNTAAAYYRLSAADIARLAAPAKALAALEKLQDKPPASTEQFEAAVTAALKGAELPVEAYLPIVLPYAQSRVTHQLTEESIRALRVKRLPSAIVELALSVQDLPFASVRDLTAALRDAERKARAADEAAEEPRLAPRLSRFLSQILGAVVASPAYLWTKASQAALEADPRFGAIAPFVVSVLEAIENVEYPTEHLFEAAVRASILDAFLLEGRPAKDGKIVKTLAEVGSLGAPAQYVDAYNAVFLKSAGSVADRRLREKMRDALPPLSKTALAAIRAGARKTHELQQNEAIRWSANGCGCVQSNRFPGDVVDPHGRILPGVVYGLFPLWHAGPEQRVDFSVLSTVGYFAVPFDDEGNLLDPLKKIDDQRLDFVKPARAHGTRIDWIIRRADWSSWPEMRKEKRTTGMFDNLVRQIDAMLTETSDHWWSVLLERVSFGTIPNLKRGDGVTLYFDNYPEDLDSVAEFQAFHRDLNDRLRKTIGENYAVNLLFPRSVLGRGIFECRRLFELTRREDGSELRNNGHFLVLIEEPTTDTKKDLRRDLEQCLTGERRRELLQAVVPVIVYDGQSKEQLRDDIAYFDQNFRGVGLWPHPQAPKKGGETTVERAGGGISAFLLYENPETGLVQKSIDKICTFVCPNRWVFRGLFEVFAILLIASFVVGLVNCRLGFAFRARPAYFYLYMAGGVAPTLLLFLSLLFCDPAWSDTREGNAPFVIMLVALIALVSWLYVRAGRKARMP